MQKGIKFWKKYGVEWKNEEKKDPQANQAKMNFLDGASNAKICFFVTLAVL